MNILVTGGSSLPGYSCISLLLKNDYNVIGLYYSHEIPLKDERLKKFSVDVRDYTSLEKIFERFRPEIIIHMAAYGDVDGCEKDHRKAWEINVYGTLSIVRLANIYSRYLIYLSTDYVFDGERGNYSEDDPPNPVNYYGLTKLCGEISVMSSNIDFLVIRASSIYGFGPGRRNFAKFLMKKLSRGEYVKALIDQYTTPTHATLLAEVIIEVIKKRLNGILHVAGERLSRYDFALKFAETFGFDKSLVGKACMDDFKWLARRPRDSSLDTSYGRKTLNIDFYSMDKAFNLLREEYTG